MQRFRVVAAAGVALLAAVALTPAPTSAQAGRASVTLELAQEFFYAGDALDVRVSVTNPGEEALDNPVRIPLVNGFKVRIRGGDKLEPAEGLEQTEPDRPDSLAPQAFYGGTFELSRLYPQLGEIGSYEIYWSGSGVISEMLTITVIPRYDPDKDYIGVIETDQGSILLSFASDQSPIAVKSFIDMANTGYYNDLQFQEVRADQFIVGGDPRYASPPRKAINYPTELSPIPLVAGMVAVKPASAAPPANGPSFIILLKPQPAWTGQVTVLGHVVRGLDIVQRISKAPSSMTYSLPHFKPLKDVTIRRVTIREKADEPKPGMG